MILIEKEYGGHFSHCIEQSGGSAVDLVELIVKKFPSYRDETVYHGQRGLFSFLFNYFISKLFILVSFYKRAQILVSDIWGCFNGHGLGHFTDMVRCFFFL
jgi:hypothetical protein